MASFVRLNVGLVKLEVAWFGYHLIIPNSTHIHEINITVKPKKPDSLNTVILENRKRFPWLVNSYECRQIAQLMTNICSLKNIVWILFYEDLSYI